MLMDGDPESLDSYLARVARRLIERLNEDERIAGWGVLEGLDSTDKARNILLAKIRLAVQVRKALDKYVSDLITYGGEERAALLDDVLGMPEIEKPTWKEIGDALGVSAQAAHRKYRRQREASDERSHRLRRAT